MIFIASMLGCFVINFPLGRIFIGDGGAYLMGAIVAMLTILLSERNPEISPFASLIIVFYPFYELVRSTVRRKLAGRNTMAPDKRHLHSLVFAYISRFGQMTDTGANYICSHYMAASLFLCGGCDSVPYQTIWLCAGIIMFIIMYELANLWLKNR